MISGGDGCIMNKPQGDVIFEQTRVGSIVRMTAIDATSGTEVIIQGPASASQHDLQRIALAKLNYVMKKQSTGTG